LGEAFPWGGGEGWVLISMKGRIKRGKGLSSYKEEKIGRSNQLLSNLNGGEKTSNPIKREKFQRKTKKKKKK